MNLDINDAVSQGFIKPASEIRISKELEEDYKDGLVFGDRDDEVLKQQHGLSAFAVNEVRVKKNIPKNGVFTIPAVTN